MAETDSDPRNTVEDEDLEDGEIDESDEEKDEPVPPKPVKPVIIEPVKKIKEEDTKKVSETRPKGDQHKSTLENAVKSNKKSASGESVPKGESIVAL